MKNVYAETNKGSNPITQNIQNVLGRQYPSHRRDCEEKSNVNNSSLQQNPYLFTVRQINALFSLCYQQKNPSTCLTLQ
jgi:hypothetical protein